MESMVRSGSRELPGDEPVEAGRYLGALQRNWPLVAATAGLLTLAVLLFSLLAPKRYEAEVRIVVNPTANVLSTSDSATVERQLATIDSLLTTRDVLASAARRLRGEDSASLEDKITATVDTNANLITVQGVDTDARRAAEIANGVALAFLDRQAELERAQFRAAQGALRQQIGRLQAQATSGAEDVGGQVRALQDRIAQLSVSAASAGSDVQIVQTALAPDGPSSPKPVRNTVLGLFAGLLLGVLLALAVDQLRPRFNSQRDLAAFLGLPVMAEIPDVRRRFRDPGAGVRIRVEDEAYQSLSASLRLALPPRERHVILVTSATHAEGKTTVAARLARLLAQAGNSTLLVSGDLRWPRLDALFGVRDSPGLSDYLVERQQGESPRLDNFTVVPWGGFGGDQDPVLEMLPAGQSTQRATRLLGADQLQPAFEEINRWDVSYVIVDAPPLLGIADARVLAHFCDHVLVVSRLDRATVKTASDLRDVLEGLGTKPLGLAVVGARITASPYYTGMRAESDRLERVERVPS